MAAAKGHQIPNAPKGRKPGAVNKTTKLVKEMISEALEGVGGVAYLMAQAKANPAAFMTLVGKLVPVQVAGDQDNPLQVQITDHEAGAKLAAILEAVKARVDKP